jgi:O-antigen/teichoic acid export membrane protein
MVSVGPASRSASALSSDATARAAAVSASTEASLAGNLRPILGEEARDSLIFTGANLLTRFGGFVLVPLYMRRLSPADFGVLAIIAVLGAFQSLLSSIAADLSITRFYYEWPERDRRRNLGALWTWNWISTLTWGGVFLIAVPHVAPFLFRGVTFSPHLLLGLIGNALASLLIVPASSIRIKRLPWLFATQSVVSFAATTSLGLWFVVARDQGLTGYLTATIWANLLMAAFGAAVMLRFSDPCLRSPGLWQAIRFALPAIPSNLVAVAGGVLDRFLLNRFSTLETLGLYAVASKFVEAISGGLHGSLKMAYGPFMMKQIAKEGHAGKATVVSVTPYYMLPYFVAALGLVLLIGPFVRLVNEPAYLPVVTWVPWLVGVAVLNCMYFYYANGLFLGNRTDLLIVPAITQLTVLVVSAMVLLPRYQLGGLVASRYLSGAAFFGLTLYLSQRLYPMHHRWRTLVQLALATVVVAAGGWFLELPNALGDVSAKLVVVAVFAFAAYRRLGRA